MAVTVKQRSFSVEITFKVGDPLTLEGEQAQNFWNMFQMYAKGSIGANGFMVTDEDEGTVCIILFENVIMACRSAITETDVEIEGCTDLNLCD